MDAVEHNILIPKKPDQTSLGIWALHIAAGIWLGANVFIPEPLRMPKGAIADSQGNIKALEVDFLPDTNQGLFSAFDFKKGIASKPKNEYKDRSNIEFFRSLDAQASAFGVGYFISNVPEGILPDDKTFFDESKLNKAGNWLWFASKVNTIVGFEIIKCINFDYTIGGRFSGHAVHKEGRIDLVMNNIQTSTFGHELMHLLSYKMGLDENLYVGNLEKFLTKLARVELNSPKSEMIAQDTIFKILYFFPEYNEVPEDFYNEHLTAQRKTNINLYAHTSYTPNGSNIEILSTIAEHDFKELFQPADKRDEVKVTRFLKLMALLKYSFPNSDIWQPNSWKFIFAISKEFPSGNDYLTRIDSYQNDIINLKHKIKIATIPPENSAAKLADPFPSTSYPKSPGLEYIEKKKNVDCAILFLLIFVALCAGYNWFKLESFIDSLIKDIQFEVDKETRKKIKNHVKKCLREKNENGKKLSQKEFELKMLEIID